MGILADLFVTTPSEADAYEDVLLLDYEAAVEKYDPTQFRRLTEMNFSILWALVLEEEWDPKNKKHALTTIRFEEPYESWLYQFPDAFCETVAALSDDEVRSVSQAWASTDELMLDRWPIDQVEEVVVALR